MKKHQARQVKSVTEKKRWIYETVFALTVIDVVHVLGLRLNDNRNQELNGFALLNCLWKNAPSYGLTTPMRESWLCKKHSKNYRLHNSKKIQENEIITQTEFL